MQLIKSSFEILEQAPGIQGVKKQIELAGRTCYKSEDKITDTSCEEFVQRMVNSGHGAMLEHGTVYLMISELVDDFESIFEDFERNKYSKTNYDGSYLYVTTNYRVLVENNWLWVLAYQCEPTIFHEKRITVKFILPISISREFIRHRTASFAEQSTRYCNFSRGKFGSELTFIRPYWFTYMDEEGQAHGARFEAWCQQAEQDYMEAVSIGLKAQEARELLPLCTKTELIMSAFTSDWEHFFKLRCHSSAHPQARELAVPLQEEFNKRFN